MYRSPYYPRPRGLWIPAAILIAACGFYAVVVLGFVSYLLGG